MIQLPFITMAVLTAAGFAVGVGALFGARTRIIALPSILLGAASIAAVVTWFAAVGLLSTNRSPVAEALAHWAWSHRATCFSTLIGGWGLVAWCVAFELPAHWGAVPAIDRIRGRRAAGLVLGAAGLLVAAREVSTRLSLEGRIYLAAEQSLSNAAPHEFHLADVATFDWDEVVVLTPYSRLERFLSIPRPSPGGPSQLGIATGKGACRIIFLLHGEIVRIHDQPRTLGDFCRDNAGPMTREEAVFSVESTAIGFEPLLRLKPPKDAVAKARLKENTAAP